ncbi:DNA-3-methyladenine glycosylase 2 family protein [uncultured Brevundimonas sp.]|uniref:DNA-3-methyladenine glycosylase family protein n=1 Tax=uncultured Brevundimonas sp. TaxID=213418 RepID=UPI0030EF7AFD|tara:strand:+ start:1220 stop:1873 length:654 start_codon:yes stop_codon:yes gene_type:complete
MNTCPGPREIAAARAALAMTDPRLARAQAQTPVFEWRARTGGFEGLLRMIVEQQVSVASAAAIWERVRDGVGEITAERVLALDVEALRGFGLSRPKARYGHEIARAQVEGRIDYDDMARLDDAAAVAALTAIKGVGRWTAETWLMFCDGRSDLFPGGDVALQEAMRWVDRAAARPSEKQAYARAEIWGPHRGIAAHLLWGWYGGVRRGEIVLEEPPP